MDITRRTFNKDLGWLVALLSILFFATNWIRPLDNPDEGRYTEIPREMLESGDWVSPRLNGVLYFEKPPLFYWLQAVSLKIGGVHEGSARFWPAMFGLIGCLVTYWGGKTLFDKRTGLFSAAILGSSLIYFALSQLVIIDMAVSVLIASALIVFMVCVREPRGRKRFLLSHAFFVLLALSVLTKGLIGLLIPCTVIFLWSLLLNKWKSLWPFYPITGILLFLAIAVPWHVLAWRANSEFAWFYFVNEHFLRYLTTTHGRYQPFWFFFAILPVALFPWFGFVFQSFIRPLSGGWSKVKERSVHLFLIIWVVFVLLFFSLSNSKLIPYILPVFPAFALLIGDWLARAFDGTRKANQKVGVYVFVGTALVLGAMLPLVAIDRGEKAADDVILWSSCAAIILALGSGCAYWTVRKRSDESILVAPFLTMSAFCLILGPLGSALRNDSTKELAFILKERQVPGSQVLSLFDYHQDLTAYLGSQITVAVCQPDEQRFGYAIEKDAAVWLSEEAFLNHWRNNVPLYAVAKREKAQAFAADNPDWEYRLIQESNRYYLICNFGEKEYKELGDRSSLAAASLKRSIPREKEARR